MKNIFLIVITLFSVAFAGITIRNAKEDIVFIVENDGQLISNITLQSSNGNEVLNNGKHKTLYFRKKDDLSPSMTFSTKGVSFFSNSDVKPIGSSASLKDLIFKRVTDNGYFIALFYDESKDFLITDYGLIIPPVYALQPNYTRLTTYRSETLKNVTTSFADGYGDIVQTQVKYDGGKFWVAGKYFNDKHQVTKDILPFTNYSFGNYLKMSDENLISLSHGYYLGKSHDEPNFNYDEKPYTEKRYLNNPTERIAEIASPTSTFAMGSGRTSKVWFIGIENKNHYVSNPKEVFEKTINVSDITASELSGSTLINVSVPWSSSSQQSINLIPNINETYNLELGSQEYTDTLSHYSDKLNSYFDLIKLKESKLYVADYFKGATEANYLLTVTRDVDGNYSQSVTDIDGKTIYTWSHDGNDEIISEFVYDEKGNLLKELTPLDSKTDEGIKLRKEYIYDKRNRLTKKYTPDAASVEFSYDRKDRITHTKNGNVTIYNRYDKLGRVDSVIINPSYKPDGSLESCVVLARNYYSSTKKIDSDIMDLFNGKDLDVFNKIVGLEGNTGELKYIRGKTFATVTFNPKEGIVTAGLGENLLSIPVVTLNSYNEEGRISASYRYFKPLGWKKVTNSYDLQGAILDVKTFTNYSPFTTSKPDFYVKNIYDFKGTLIANIDGLTGKKLASYVHNEAGQLKEKSVYDHNGNLIETTKLNYDVRGSVSKLTTGDLFSEELYYYNYNGGTGAPQNYNGNISRTKYSYNLGAEAFSVSQDFTYDALNRLRNVDIGSVTGDSKGISYIKKLTEEFDFDKNGRLTARKRGTDGSIENFTYNYNENPLSSVNTLSNRLSGVSGYHSGYENSNYVYDANGNMEIDYSKNMAVYYNYQNMPVRFEFYKDVADLKINTRASFPLSTVDMVYDGNGKRLAKIETVDAYEGNNKVVFRKGTIYDGTNVYKAESNNLVDPLVYSLAYRKTGVGRIEYEDGKPKETYAYLVDHLGSTRMTINSQKDVVQADLYTALGDEITIENTMETKEKFTGKELDKDGAIADVTAGIALNYFGWRYYDPKLGLWISVDPKEQFLSGYSYGANFINTFDPDGLYSWSQFRSDLFYFSLDAAEGLVALSAGIGSGGSFGLIDKFNDKYQPGWRNERYANNIVYKTGQFSGVCLSTYLSGKALWSTGKGVFSAGKSFYGGFRVSALTNYSGFVSPWNVGFSNAFNWGYSAASIYTTANFYVTHFSVTNSINFVSAADIIYGAGEGWSGAPSNSLQIKTFFVVESWNRTIEFFEQFEGNNPPPRGSLLPTTTSLPTPTSLEDLKSIPVTDKTTSR